MKGNLPIIWNGGGAPPPEFREFLGKGAAEVAQRYPVALSPYWLARCKSADGAPFRLQAFPDARELDAPLPGDSGDPFAELACASPLPGVVRRFADRILVVVTDACAVRCRHCTRKNILGTHAIPAWRDYPKIADYIRANPAIREVLLSGGDPLALSQDALERRVDIFADLGQIYSVRIGTRIPCSDPARVSPALAKGLGRSRKVWVNTQFNHPAEVTPEAARACALLIDAGIPVSCQTVLVKGLNDNADTLEALFRALQAIRVRPYYAFAGDPVTGTGHFRVTSAEAAALEREVAGRVGGLALPRFVADIPGAGRKTPVVEAAALGSGRGICRE